MTPEQIKEAAYLLDLLERVEGREPLYFNKTDRLIQVRGVMADEQTFAAITDAVAEEAVERVRILTEKLTALGIEVPE